MQIDPTSQASNTSQATNSQSTPPQQELNGQAFMTLLVAQLQSQDPFQPMDPTTMVGQLVQFNSLNELVQIRQDIENKQTSGAAAPPVGPSNMFGTPSTSSTPSTTP